MNPENHHPDFSELPHGPFGNLPRPTRQCDETELLIPAYSINATDAEEAAFVQTSLAHCPQAADNLREFNALATRMLFSAPPVAAPQHLANRLHSAIIASAAAAARNERAVGIDGQRRRPPLLRQRSHDRRPQRPKPTPLPAAMADYRLEQGAGRTRSAVVQSPRPRSQRSAGWYFGRALATVAAIALLVGNITLILQNQRLMAQTHLLTEQNQQLVLQQDAFHTTLAQQNRALILLAAEEPQEIEIFDPTGATTAKADILWNDSLGIAVVYVRDFPQCESGKKYQLWLTKDGERSSGGLFSVDASGMGLLVVSIESSLDAYDAIGITQEPATGSPGPTAPPVVRGEL